MGNCESPGTPSDHGVSICSMPGTKSAPVRGGPVCRSEITRTMEMDRRRKWHSVVHQELNIVALSQSQLRRRELFIAQDDCPVETGDFTLLPSQSNMKPDWLFGRPHIKAIATSGPLYQAKESQPSQFAIEGLHAVLYVRRCQSCQIASALDRRKQCLLRTVQCSPPLTSSQAN